MFSCPYIRVLIIEVLEIRISPSACFYKKENGTHLWRGILRQNERKVKKITPGAATSVSFFRLQ
jgi:hypothetical protein